MNKITLDIETIPVEESKKELAVTLATKKAMKYSKKSVKPSKDSIYRTTALSGDWGQILCIGYAINDEKVRIITGKESDILKKWWDVVKDIDLFIGHNVMDFDLKFIFKRSIIHKIKPNSNHYKLSFARYRNFPIFDTMREWEKWGSSNISLDNLATILGFESSKSKGIDGSKVYDFYKTGKLKEIYDYCKRDVELTRKIYLRLIFNQ